MSARLSHDLHTAKWFWKEEKIATPKEQSEPANTRATKKKKDDVREEKRLKLNDKKASLLKYHIFQRVQRDREPCRTAHKKCSQSDEIEKRAKENHMKKQQQNDMQNMLWKSNNSTVLSVSDSHVFFLTHTPHPSESALEFCYFSTHTHRTQTKKNVKEFAHKRRSRFWCASFDFVLRWI